MVPWFGDIGHLWLIVPGRGLPARIGSGRLQGRIGIPGSVRHQRVSSQSVQFFFQHSGLFGLLFHLGFESLDRFLLFQAAADQKVDSQKQAGAKKDAEDNEEFRLGRVWYCDGKGAN